MSHPGPPPQASYGYPPQQPPTQQGYGYPHQQPYGVPYPASQQSGFPYAVPFVPQPPPYAGWPHRAGAFLLDCALNFGPMWVLMGFGIALEGRTGESGDVVANVLSWLGILAMIVTVVFQLRREGRSGQTVGKKALGIRAVRAYDAQMLGVGLALGRRLLQFLNCFACGLGWLWALWDDRSQTFADKITSVVVVRADAVPGSRTADA
ncbi:RDD family protein [Streptomyces sclerotialus]|uniref:RDD family protein n=1 Tax=Streptomyces sclerotialus TaxID=1957 RepID=UPI00056D1B27